MIIVLSATLIVLLLFFIIYSLVENESDIEQALMKEMQNTVHPFEVMDDLKEIKWNK